MRRPLDSPSSRKRLGLASERRAHDARDGKSDYVNDLETRVKWLEALLQEKVPGVDLSAAPGRPPNGRPQETAPVEGPAALPLPEPEPDAAPDQSSLREISEQIGLVSVTAGADLRYLGPSSGLFFTRYVLAGLAKHVQIERPRTERSDEHTCVPPDLLIVQPSGLPQGQRQARWLSEAYFDFVHPRYPFLHEPTFQRIIQEIYDGTDVGAIREFQVFLVLAIGATIHSRRAKIMLGAEGYYVSAMARMDDVVKSTSLETAQCILLLEMYALNNPSSGLSLWPLHYQALAITVELGLQRNFPGRVHTAYQEQIRTRIFWCVYSIDRLLSTLMGRPMGVVDEQCDLRLPLDVNDGDLSDSRNDIRPRQPESPLTAMSSAIHLFRISRLNSEIKCVLYCTDRNDPPYTQRTVTDAAGWRADILGRLRQWRREIPLHPEGSRHHHMNLLCEITYHELVMLVLRPSPRLQQPDRCLLRQCFDSAMECCGLYRQLYVTKSLHYGWMSVHSLFLCVMVMFYCVWTPRGVAEDADPHALMRALKSSSDILSAMGEYWPEATRSRDILDRVSAATIRRFFTRAEGGRSHGAAADSGPSAEAGPSRRQDAVLDWSQVGQDYESLASMSLDSREITAGSYPTSYGTHDDAFMSPDMLSFFLGNGMDVETAGGGTGSQAPYEGVDGVVYSLFGDNAWDVS